MAKPTNTIGDRDYGRRTYASNKKYEEQRKLATNAHIDRVRRLEKHSEFKKPYLPDQSYPEMEGFNFDPYDPKWPGLPPGEPPTTGPVDPGGPIPPWKFDPDKPPQFLGCQFPGNFRPNPVKPGKWSMGDIWIGSMDSIASIVCHGPGHCEFSLSDCNQKTNISHRPGEERGPGMCSITVWANKNILPREGTTIVIAVEMASGMKCATTVDIQPCDEDDPGPQWDWTRSPQTVAPNSGATVYIQESVGDILMGAPPFTWSITGTGYSFPVTRTYGRVNSLVTELTACGTGSITVIDSCGKSCNGEIRSTTGNWVQDLPYGICHGVLMGQVPNDGAFAVYGGKKLLQTYAVSGNWNAGCTTPTCNCSGPCSECDCSIFGQYYSCYECLAFDCSVFQPDANLTGNFGCCTGGLSCDGKYEARYCPYTTAFISFQWLCG